MARLEIEIVTNGDGAAKAEGILQGLQKTANNLKIELFKASTRDELNQVGSALSSVTDKIKAYTNEALKGSQAFKDTQTLDTLIKLETKLTQISNNQKLLGDDTKRANAEINAFQATINKLIANGLDPADKEITDLQSKITGLSEKIKELNATPAVNIADKFRSTGNSLVDTENKVKRLQEALRMPNLSDRQISKYNERLQKARIELERINNLGVDDTLNKTSGNMKNLAGSSNLVAVEFGRIIQDAPYAANNFGSIGNNITQLATNFGTLSTQMKANAAATGTTVTTAAIARTAFASMLTPINLVVIGISVLTSAFTFYQMSAQKANKATKESGDEFENAKQELDKYIESLGRYEKLSAKSSSGYSEEIAKLDLLYEAVQKNTNARYGNGTAIEEMQRLWPSVFADLNENKKLTDENSRAYLDLRQSIIETAKAQAALKLAASSVEDLTKAEAANRDINRRLDALDKEEKALKAAQMADKNAKDKLDEYAVAYLNIDEKVKNLKKEQDKYTESIRVANDAIREYRDIASESFDIVAKTTRENSGIIDKLKAKIDNLNTIRPTLTVRSDIDKNLAEVKKLQAELDILNGKEVKLKAAKISIPTDYQSQLDKILNRGEVSADKAGLTGQALDLTNTFNKYKQLYDNTRAIEAKALADTQLSESKKNAIIASAIEIRKQLREDEGREFLAITEKYAKKEVDIATQVQKQLSDLDKKYAKKESPAIESLKSQLLDYEKILGQIKDATSSTGLDALLRTGTIKLQIEQVRNREANQPEKIVSDFSKGINRGINQFTRKFFESIDNISQYADSTFKGATSSIINNMLSSFNSISFSFVSDLISKQLEKGINNGTDTLALKLAGAATIAGGIISGATNKTSSIGQGLGGALSGAGAGAMIGTALGPGGIAAGAVIGGLIGAIGGLFGASDARKKERELLQKQLEEQKKANELARQQAQAFSAAIIGQMSNRGLVTGVGRDAFGNVELYSKLQGRDIVLSSKRELEAQKRGT